MSRIIRFFVIFVMLALVILPPSPASTVDAYAEITIDSMSNWNCSSPRSADLTFTIRSDTVDEVIGTAEDWYYIRIIDGNGLVLYSQVAGFGVPRYIRYTATLTETGWLLWYPWHAPTANPVRVEFWEYVGPYTGGHITSLLDSASFNSPCITNNPPVSTSVQQIDPVVAAEQAQGIYRAYDDHHGVVVYARPNGDYDYYAPTGCFIGRMSASMLSGINYGERGLLYRTGECNGYRVDVWSLGYPACQVQFNMYGPNGYGATYALAQHASNSTCAPDATFSPDIQAPIQAYQEATGPLRTVLLALGTAIRSGRLPALDSLKSGVGLLSIANNSLGLVTNTQECLGGGDQLACVKASLNVASLALSGAAIVGGAAAVTAGGVSAMPILVVGGTVAFLKIITDIVASL